VKRNLHLAVHLAYMYATRIRSQRLLIVKCENTANLFELLHATTECHIMATKPDPAW